MTVTVVEEDFTINIGVAAVGPQGPKGDIGNTGAPGLVHRGAWAAATVYAVNDAVTHLGGTYRRKVAGTTATAPNLDAVNWEVLAAKGDTGNTGTAATLALGTVTTSAPGSSAVITNSGNTAAAVFNFTLPRGDTGPANTLTPGTITTGAPGSAVSASVTGTAPNQTLNLTIPRGDVGASNTLSVGTVTTGAEGSNVTVGITGTSPNQTLNFAIPRGNTGPANVLTMGTVTTGAAGSTAAATITGTAPNQTLTLTIPRGDTGLTGPANTLTMGTVTTLATGASATASITGTAPNQTLSLGLPRGATGLTGAAGATWYSGNGVPSAGTGLDGDYYLNTSTTSGTGDVYRKAAGTWSINTNIRGLPGAGNIVTVNGDAGPNVVISYATLGVIPASSLPALAINEWFEAASQAAMLALTAQRGDMVRRTDTGRTYFLASDSPSTLADWKQVNSDIPVTTVAGRTGDIVLTKTDVGLANVDNTTDLLKPISTATQTALNLKANTSNTVTTDTAQTITGVKTFGAAPIVSMANAYAQISSTAAGGFTELRVISQEGVSVKVGATATVAAIGTVSANHDVAIVRGNATHSVFTSTGLTLNTGSFTGSGSGLTALNGTQVTTGTIPVARLDATVFSTTHIPEITEVNGLSAALAARVDLTNAQTIAGIKTFSSSPVVPDNSWTISDTAGLQSALDAKADDTNTVTTDTAQTITANKTFATTGGRVTISHTTNVADGLVLSNTTAGSVNSPRLFFMNETSGNAMYRVAGALVITTGANVPATSGANTFSLSDAGTFTSTALSAGSAYIGTANTGNDALVIQAPTGARALDILANSGHRVFTVFRDGGMTSWTRGGVAIIAQNQVADTTNLYEGKNIAGTTVFSVSGAGVVSTSEANIGGRNFRNVTRTAPATGGDTVELGTTAYANGAGLTKIDVVWGNSGISVSKSYIIPSQWSPTSTGWRTVQPVQSSGPYGALDFDLEAIGSNGTATFRVRRISTNASVGTFDAKIEMQSYTSMAWTDSTVTAAAPAATVGAWPYALNPRDASYITTGTVPIARLDAGVFSTSHLPEISEVNTLTTALAGKVGLAGNETITGAKTFSSGDITLNNATSNRIVISTTAGVTGPTNTTRSAGTKFVLYPSLNATDADFALGIESGAMWFSTASTGNSYKWYGGTTVAATLSGGGNLTITGTYNGNGSGIHSINGTNIATGTVPVARLDANVFSTTHLPLTSEVVGLDTALAGTVKTTGDQTIAGVKTFSSEVLLANGLSGNAARIGNDSRIVDIDTANTMGIVGTGDVAQGYVRFGSSWVIGANGANGAITGNLAVSGTITSGGNAVLLVAGDQNITGYKRFTDRVQGNSFSMQDVASQYFDSATAITGATGQIPYYGMGQFSYNDGSGTVGSNASIAGYFGVSMFANGSERLRINRYGDTFIRTGSLAVNKGVAGIHYIDINNSDTTATGYTTQSYLRLSVGGATVGGIKTTNTALTGLSAKALYITTEGAYPIAFGTDNGAIPKMVIMPTTGRVGIGNQAPTEMLDVTGNISASGSLNLAGGAINLNNATSNMISFSQGGVAAPAVTTRSAGTKLILYPQVSGTSVDYAIGMEGSTMWFSLPTAADNLQYKWYGGTTQAMRLGGTGILSTATSMAAPTVTSTATTNSLNVQRFIFTVATATRPTGSAYVEWVGPVAPNNAIDGDTWVNNA